jgi:hypothetical protein
MRKQGLRTFLVLAGIAAAGCDAVASNRYQGDVLATLQGMVVSDGQPTPIPLEVALVWGRPEGQGIKFIAEKVPITGSFPAEFTLQLHHPPPKQAGWPVTGGRMNLAFIAALARDEWTQGTKLEKGRNVLAYALADEILVHLDRDLDQGIPGLGGVRTAGFHLIEIATVSADEARREAEACRQLYPRAPADACEPEPGLDGKFQVVRAVNDGLARRMKLELTFPDYTVVSGGDDDEPPCDDCGDLVGSKRGASPSGGASNPGSGP